MNIVYTLNDKFVPQVAASMCSVCENNTDFKQITFFLISMGINSKNKECLKSFINKYNRELQIIELENLKNYFEFEFDTNGWNPIVLSRLILDKMLPQNISKVLYLDDDTIVRGNLSDLWNDNMNDMVIGASIEPTMDKSHKASLGLKYSHYYNAGVLLINLKKWRQENTGLKILNYYKEHQGKLFANDQDAINGALKNEIYTLLPKYNFYNIFWHYPYSFLKKLEFPAEYISQKDFMECKDNPAIIHYLGEERPWRKHNTHLYKDDYIKYLSKTPWQNTGFEDGWKMYFICWKIFNVITKPFPGIRFAIINSLIPLFIKIRSNKLKKNGEK